MANVTNNQERQDALVREFEDGQPDLVEALRTIGLAEAAYAEALSGLIEPQTEVAANTTTR